MSDVDSITDAMLQCACASRPTHFISFQRVTNSQSTHSLCIGVYVPLYFSATCVFVCLCSLRYDSSRVRRTTGIWPNIDKGTIHENVIIRNVPKKCCVDTMSEFTCLPFKASDCFQYVCDTLCGNNPMRFGKI